MSTRFVNIDHNTPILLPPDLRDWGAPDHMVHFIMDAVVALDLSRARTNKRGTGSARYPPSMMPGLLIYCYAAGAFSSRRIETLASENVAVRLLTADITTTRSASSTGMDGEWTTFTCRHTA